MPIPVDDEWCPQEVGSGVWAAVQPHGGWFINNAGFMIGSDRALLVDTFVSERRTRGLLAAVEQALAAVGHGGAELLLVLTHAHGDHANGAGTVAGRLAAPAMAAAATADHLQVHGIERYPGLFAPADWGDVHVPAEFDRVVGDRQVDLGGLIATVHDVPGIAHTSGDLVVTVPDHGGVVFAGDLVWSGVTPLAVSGSVVGWLAALDWLDRLPGRIVVPGHGPVAGRELIGSTRDYLTWIVTCADSVLRGGLAAADIMQLAATTRWSAWTCPERHVANLRRALTDLDPGRHPFDFLATAGEMAAAADGPLTLPT